MHELAFPLPFFAAGEATVILGPSSTEATSLRRSPPRRKHCSRRASPPGRLNVEQVLPDLEALRDAPGELVVVDADLPAEVGTATPFLLLGAHAIVVYAFGLAERVVRPAAVAVIEHPRRPRRGSGSTGNGALTSPSSPR